MIAAAMIGAIVIVGGAAAFGLTVTAAYELGRFMAKRGIVVVTTSDEF